MMLHYALRPGKCSRSSVARIKICLKFADTCLEEMVMPQSLARACYTVAAGGDSLHGAEGQFEEGSPPPAGGDASLEPEQ